MENQPVYIPDLSPEFVFQASRSGGPGGQNVNKVNTRVALRFSIARSELLSSEQKQLLLEKLASKITIDGLLQVVSQKERSQLMNKEACIAKLYALIEKALTPQKKRRATRPTKTSMEKRIQGKKLLGEKKSLRGKVDF
ncbi:MAG: peptide chain release factor 1 [Bacteroidetes bacterium GWF2_42_66]|nr:MAG: peptide chain release factor 1 [Bacteroidetes bacterium GWA2_42_15]OFX97869.1 MAG: peptide chain release factor 1 [Bacteroidetes bacterium GWE2_42_39]OFY44154.1 MAG: peptide chain release factor 1 [Bacteroidetes bacterium GWF2_42_66]HBL74600.1 aminoacyl-tRNA hydrolase [Prolixibacteraceae bacterium]HCR91540.1 aminoacyl-tRNA hydrolase [Prolixibacteraceae bacterium]